jgi:Cu/Ag efflux protein CusF
MIKRITAIAAIALSAAFLFLVLIMASAAYAQRQGGPDQDQPRNGRIVKGTIESISDGKVTVAVESILIPREGEMSDAPKNLSVIINEDSRFVNKEKGRNAKRADFKKGDDVVLMVVYEDGKFTLRAMLTPEIAVEMRQQMGEKMRDRGNGRGASENSPYGPRGGGRPGPGFGSQGGERLRDNPPVFVAVFEGRTNDSVKLTIVGILKPSDGEKPTIEKLPEKKSVTVVIGDNTRLFIKGKKATIKSFKKGDEVIVVIPRREGEKGKGRLALMADKESAAKLREMLRDRIQDRKRDREQ